jgi:uncharacterized lipoprotein YmbA
LNSEPAQVGPAANHRITVGLGPVTIPKYLDRPEVVTRLSDTEFKLSDTDRWGEPLGANVSRVLAADLSGQRANLEVVQMPWPRKSKFDYRVSIDFQRLEANLDGQVQVRAAWSIRNGSDNDLMQTGSTSMSLPSAANDPKAAAHAMGQGVAQVASDIAQCLQRLPAPKPARMPISVTSAIQTRD